MTITDKAIDKIRKGLADAYRDINGDEFTPVYMNGQYFFDGISVDDITLDTHGQQVIVHMSSDLYLNAKYIFGETDGFYMLHEANFFKELTEHDQELSEQFEEYLGENVFADSYLSSNLDISMQHNVVFDFESENTELILTLNKNQSNFDYTIEMLDENVSETFYELVNDFLKSKDLPTFTREEMTYATTGDSNDTELEFFENEPLKDKAFINMFPFQHLHIEMGDE